MTTLQKLDDAVHHSLEAAATEALSQFASERIYGLFLIHYIFSSYRVAVLTEAHRERSEHKAEKWSPAVCEYYFYREDLFDEPNRLLASLADLDHEEDIASIFVRAVQHVRQAIITDPQVVLGIVD